MLIQQVAGKFGLKTERVGGALGQTYVYGRYENLSFCLTNISGTNSVLVKIPVNVKSDAGQ